jgi:formylmethanofuran dehydrogenase subunit C
MTSRDAPAPLTLRLRLREAPAVPVEADSLCPDRIDGLARDQVRALTLYCGNKKKSIGDFFEVEGSGAETIEIEGDLRCFKKIGLGMTRGRLVVRGDVGMHLGAEMRGGEIEVFGGSGDWTGAEMKGGLIHVHGDAGNRAGAAYRGSETGMRHGAILIEGNAGVETGAFMRRGLIAVGGNAGDFTGAQMIAGSILVCGALGDRSGGGMRRGTIVTLRTATILPTFRDAGAHRFPFLRILFSAAAGRGLPVPVEAADGLFRRHVGDVNELGLGEILVPAVERA